MDDEATGTATETPEVVEAQEAETAEIPAADTETADTETGEAEEKTPEQIEIDARAAAIAKSKAGTDPVIQKRIDKITKQSKLESEAAYWRGRAEALEQAGAKPAPAQQEAEVLEAPKPENFETTADFVQAVSAYSVKKAMQDVELAQQRKAQAAEAAKASQAAAEVRSKMIQEGVKEFGEDFEDEVINNPELKISQVMAAALYDSKAGHVMAKHLHDNPAEATRIFNLSPVAQVRELVALESKIMAARQPKTTQTPAPIKPLKGGAASDVDMSKLSDEEWHRLRDKQRQEQRKGRV